MKKWFLTALIFSCVFALYGKEYFKLHNVTVQIPENSTAMQREAAAELKLHLSKLLTAPLKVNGKVPTQITMFVGFSPAAERAGFTGLPAADTLPGKFAVCRRGNDFLFYGWDSQPEGSLFNGKQHCGTFFAVSYFVQKYLQIKFIMPGERYTFYPEKAEITFAADSDIPKPSYLVRHFGNGGKNSSWRENTLWYRRRFGDIPQIARADYVYMFINNWNKRFADRKELFALHDGRRINESYPYHFPCTSNPDVLKQIVADIVAEKTKNPSINAIRFFCDAPVKTCECTNCRNSPAGKFVTEEDHSETVYALLSQIGNELHKLYPDMRLHAQTKGKSYHQPPRSIKLTKNVVITILTAHFTQPDYNAIRRQCRQWREAGAVVMVKSYPRAPEMKDYPIMNPHRIVEYFKELSGSMEGSVVSESRGNVMHTFSRLNNYVHSAVMFDASVNADALITEFCRLAAPQAAKELRSFYDSMEALQSTANFRDDPLMNCYIYFRLQEPVKHIDAALKKSPDNPFLQELHKDFMAFVQKSADCSKGIANEKELAELFRSFAERHPAVKLSEKPCDIKFRNFAFYRDYQKTDCKVYRKGDALILDAVCYENQMDELVIACKKNHQGQIWNDDVLEIFFGKAGQQEPYIHVTVNAGGFYRVIRRSGGAEKEMNSVTLTNTRVTGKDHWQMQIAMPLAPLAELTTDGKIQMAVYRHRPARNGDKNQMSGAQKPLTGAFRDISGRFELQLQK